jgi:large subunit ribosomal protein L21
MSGGPGIGRTRGGPATSRTRGGPATGRTRGGPATGRTRGGIVFAIIKSGGRQVRVSPGSVVTVDRLSIAPGERVSIDQVLFVGTDDGKLIPGSPFVENARVVGVIAGESRGPKVRVFKKKRRKGYKRSAGHRATLTRVEIKEITL